MTDKKSFTYAEAGVDIGRADEAKKRIKSLIESTYTRGVVGGFGHFGGCFSGNFEGYKEPILVSSSDGVGTKIKIACMMKVYDTVGIDIVHHCVNDIAVMGAEPLFFLDYIGLGRLEPEVVRDIIAGLVTGCKNADTALIAGETAEMPDVYAPGDFDLAGFIVGVVDKDKIVDGSTIEEGDLIYGFKSNGLHTNGYTLARKICFEHKGYKPDQVIHELGGSVGGELLKPHMLYLKSIRKLRDNDAVKGFAHVTGGGIEGNLKRIFPDGLTFKINTTNWQKPVILNLLQEYGNVETTEMFHTFNMGIGLIYVVSADKADGIAGGFADDESRPILIGEVVKGETPELIYE